MCPELEDFDSLAPACAANDAEAWLETQKGRLKANWRCASTVRTGNMTTTGAASKNERHNRVIARGASLLITPYRALSRSWFDNALLSVVEGFATNGSDGGIQETPKRQLD